MFCNKNLGKLITSSSKHLSPLNTFQHPHLSSGARKGDAETWARTRIQRMDSGAPGWSGRSVRGPVEEASAPASACVTTPSES